MLIYQNYMVTYEIISISCLRNNYRVFNVIHIYNFTTNESLFNNFKIWTISTVWNNNENKDESASCCVEYKMIIIYVDQCHFKPT